MIVFGDRPSVRSPARSIEAMRLSLAGVLARPGGIERHAELVALLLASGELAQGAADAALAREGVDRPDRLTAIAMRAAVVLARAVWRSHQSGYAAAPLDGCRAALEELAAAPWPEALTARAGEGFQHYAVYPEMYAAAASAACADGRPPLVIGIRSIGATLAAAVAGALPESAEVPLTVRPVGPPFERRLAPSPALAEALAAAAGRTVAVVDEGPGLSGSSFGAVLDALDEAGVPESHVRVFPSHAGDVGAAAAPRTRARWARITRAHVSFEAAFLDPARPGLADWVRDLIGPLDEPPRDVGAGEWRALVWDDRRAWPPAIAARERRKFLLCARGERFLARFIGLGDAGQAAAARAETLAVAGFSPPVVGVRHGFLITRWVTARRLSAGAPEVPRDRLIAWLAQYLAFRAERFPAGASRGADPAALLALARLNARECGAPDAAAALERFVPRLDGLARAARPLEIDGRLHVWEWLSLPDGRLWKTDAVDHCDGHDPIGCQDLAWDVAGAAFELGLEPFELDALLRVLGARGLPVEPEALAFHRAAYLAFQLALYASAIPGAADPAEAARLSGAAERYRRALESDARSGAGAGRP